MVDRIGRISYFVMVTDTYQYLEVDKMDIITNIVILYK